MSVVPTATATPLAVRRTTTDGSDTSTFTPARPSTRTPAHPGTHAPKPPHAQAPTQPRSRPPTRPPTLTHPRFHVKQLRSPFRRHRARRRSTVVIHSVAAHTSRIAAHLLPDDVSPRYGPRSQSLLKDTDHSVQRHQRDRPEPETEPPRRNTLSHRTPEHRSPSQFRPFLQARPWAGAHSNLHPGPAVAPAATARPPSPAGLLRPPELQQSSPQCRTPIPGPHVADDVMGEHGRPAHLPRRTTTGLRRHPSSSARARTSVSTSSTRTTGRPHSFSHRTSPGP